MPAAPRGLREDGQDPTGPLRLGSHLSVAGGVSTVFARGEEVGCAVLQIFVKNNNRWRGAPLTDEEVERFEAERRRTRIWPVFAHGTYLVNLASPDRVIRERSVACTVEELRRCDRLGLPWLVVHPGAHLGAGIAGGIDRVARTLERVLEATPGSDVMVLLETTAGQGSTLGRTAEELGALLKAVDAPDRLGVCFDTCHVFASGYELRTRSGYARTMARFEEAVGLERIRVFHLNDSLRPLGSNRDRHAHIGEGEIGDAGFRHLLRDPVLRDRPMVLETPKEGDADRRNLARLRRLATRRRR